jgi:hypothetical protein
MLAVLLVSSMVLDPVTAQLQQTLRGPVTLLLCAVVCKPSKWLIAKTSE